MDRQTADWQRFAGWSPAAARLALGVLLIFMALAAVTPLTVGKGEAAKSPPIGAGAAPAVKQERFDDLRLYDAVIARMQGGERYYDVIVEEHRKLPFPVRPGFAVRLPTLAWVAALIGPAGLLGTSFILLGAIVLAWWRRLGEEPGGAERRPLAMTLLLVGSSFLLVRYFHVLHELWAGGLLALAFGLHRPGRRFAGAVAVAALALAVRETALPFVLLALAMAAWNRDWRECVAWTGLAAAFVALWSLHLELIAAQVLPGDPLSPPWITLRGLSGALSALILPTPLRFLPATLAGPAMVLVVFGWTAWRSAAGAFGTLLVLGYALAFMIAGRPENWYWGALLTPVVFVGLAFAPAGLRSLMRSAFPARA